jgi:hypothetical protein
VTTHRVASRPTTLLAAIAAIALSMLYLVNPVAAAGFTPGQNGTPTDGTNSDLQGGTATFTFEQNGQLNCDGDTATSFHFTVDYVIDGTLPANSSLVIYLSPNQGAINNNANGDPAGYIADVESNYTVKDVSGLSGSGSFTVDVTVGTAFQLSGGGVLGVFASEAGDGQSWDSKTNSLQCSEAQSVAESASAAESVPASVPASGEGSQKAGEGTPAGSVSNGAMSTDGSSPQPTIAFSLIMLASLGALAYANVKSVRNIS